MECNFTRICYNEALELHPSFQLIQGLFNIVEHAIHFVHLGRNTGSLRLVNSLGTTSSGQGRLEIYLNGQWGTVCDDGFGADDARVVCNQLGFSSYNRYGNVVALRYVYIYYSRLSVYTCTDKGVVIIAPPNVC